MDLPQLDLPPQWREALDRALAATRILVVGPTDVGKSSFIRALAALRPPLHLLDLDPGQKMIGAPGTASLGRLGPAPRLERFVFLGSIAAGGFAALERAAGALADGTSADGLVVNSSGYVRGAGARLQAMILESLRPDLVVAIGTPADFEPVLDRAGAAAIVRLAPSPFARRKSAGMRRRIRQASFDAALAGAQPLTIARAGLILDPAPPAPLPEAQRPVCALADAAGEDREIAILVGLDAMTVSLFGRTPPKGIARVRLGRMWAEPGAQGWRLLERLAPAWASEG